MRATAPLRALVGFLSLALLAAGCTGGDDPAEGFSAVASASPAADETPSDIEPSASPAEPTEVFEESDRVLSVAIGEAATLDPMRIQDPGSVLIARQLYEGLTRWDPTEEEVVPAAAASWDARDGGRTFVFKLRPGMTFHDGSPVTSEDFRFAFDRIAQKANASDLAFTLEMVDGFLQVNQLGSEDRLSGIETPNSLTLVIKLSEPFYDFPAVLTAPGLVPLKSSAVRDIDTFLNQPVGNGPFQVAEPWTPGRELLLEAFPGFIDTPELDGMRFVPFDDAAASWLPFVNGDLDVAEVPPGRFEAAADVFGDDGFKPFLAGYYFGINIQAESLKDPKLRRAINRAIDRETIAQTIYKGTLEPPRGIVPDGMPGFEENLCVNVCDYSPETAARLVADLPAKKRSVTIAYTTGEPHGKVARAVKEDLEAAGLTVRLRPYSFPKYLRLLRDDEHGVYRLGWIAEYPTADVFLSALFGSGSPDNHSGFESPKVDKLLSQARAESSAGARVQLYIQAEKEVMKKLPIAPIGSFVTHWAAQTRVEGIEFDVMGGFDAAAVSIAEGVADE